MTWDQIAGPLVGGVIAFIGVMLTQWFTARRERKNRTNTHLSRLIDKRYDLYIEYVNVINDNAGILLGENYSGADPDDVLQRLVPLERNMQVFASSTVIGALEEYRDVMRRLASWDILEEQQQAELQREEHIVSHLALEAIRADLKIDSYESWLARRRNFRRVKRTMLAYMPEIDRVAAERAARRVDAPERSSEDDGGTSP
ncbi:hypothetical protein [Amycolatopsis sp. Hca4]|uniref:hypothetical protein n=1 Tax=Amycolatopsis sp. Hca4 TaxID=2742131 RepID=UPI0015906797|nr:hypothetical protein [Amycolatopsis sp. Hca4]QKV74123.1 hypothetical protein HUT10_10355 [Amycolatopsis sp. Hca4]